MTILTPEMRQEALDLAEAMKAKITDAEYAAALPVAEQFRASLLAVCGSDAAAARVASTISFILANVTTLPLFAVYEEMSKYVVEYTIAAGIAAQAAPEEAEDAAYGQYL